MKRGESITFRQVCKIPAPGVKSLVWHGDTLVDWAGGHARFELDGSFKRRSVSYSYRFDAACASPSGEFEIIYERLGTKGLVLHRGKILREINRSFYHADDYEYPLLIARLPNGREVLVHCPDAYNQLEIDDVLTGERLTACSGRNPRDFFHSRLSINPSGTLLLSAGWVWHPVDLIAVYGIEDALDDPTLLDAEAILPIQATDVGSAAFTDDRQLVVATGDEPLADQSDFDEPVLQQNSIARLDLNTGRIEVQSRVAEKVGTIMPVGSDYAVGFHDHPKVFRIETGEVVARLSELKTGTQTSSIIRGTPALPPLAVDASASRFAVADGSFVTVIQVCQTA